MSNNRQKHGIEGVSEDILSSKEQRKKEAYARYLEKKRRKRRRQRLFVTIIVLLAIIIGYGVARVEIEVNQVLGAMSRNPDEDLDQVDLSDIPVIEDNEVVNLLLIGADKRSGDSDDGRSDSVMIATIDKRNNEIKLTSLMRDLFVEIPGYLDNRLNAAYSFGGVQLLYQTIAKNFGLKLDGYLLVDFSAFKDVINKIGGIEIEITESEYEHLLSYYAKKKENAEIQKLQPGKNVMNGVQALCYARIRKEGNGDFRRTERQRTVMQAIFTKAKSQSIVGLYDTMKEVLPYITTDLSNAEMLSYMKTVIFMGTTEIHQFRIPVDGLYTNETIRKMKVLVPDLEANRTELLKFIQLPASE